MNVIGLDLSLSGTGIGVIDDQERLVDVKLVATKPNDGTKIERCDFIATTIGEMVKGYAPHLIVIENYAFAMRGALVDLAELGGIVKRELWEITGVAECWMLASSPSVQKLVTGSAAGKSPERKARMINAIQPYFNAAPRRLQSYAHRTDDNVCDSVGLAIYGLRTWGHGL